MNDVKHARPGLSPAFVEGVAGLSAGSIATLVVHPLDIIKTRMQIYRSATATTPSTSLTAVSVARELLASRTRSPIAALYRGLTPNLIGNASGWASFFFFKSGFEQGIAAWKQQRQAIASPEKELETKEEREKDAKALLTPTDFFLASLLAGAATQLLTNPIWVLKTRMLSSDAGAAGAYPSMLAGAAAILRTEGPRGFYRGLAVGMLAVSNGAVQFGVYEPAKRVYLSWKRLRRERRRHSSHGSDVVGDDKEESDDGRKVSNEATVLLSTASKAVAGAATYPLQVLRSRLQNYDAEARFGRGIRGVAARVWSEEGLRGFYRGLVPGVVRVLPATWVTFLVYENVRYYLPRWAERR